MKKLLAILMILTLSSCMVSQKAFDSKIDEMQKQIDSKLPRYEFEVKDQILRQSINDLQKGCCKVKKDTLTDEEKFVIDSNDEMNERKDMIISGIINGKSKFLETTSTKVLLLLKPSVILLRLLKNCVGQINSTNEHTIIYLINK